MFPATGSENLFSEENAAKWKGIFVSALHGVHQQVHPSLVAKDDALDYIESLILNLLVTLCVSHPHSVQDIIDRVNKTFPDPIDKWAIRDANSALEKGRKNTPLVLPVDKIHTLLIKEALGYRIEFQVTLYIVAVLEYIAADILKLTGNYVRNIKHAEITSQDIKVAICADQVLMDMFSQEEDVSLPVVEEPIKTESLKYEDIVKDFIHEETQYMRDLNMIIKVFRAPFVTHFPRSKDLEVIFSNILDIYEFTANLLSSVEEQVEMAAEKDLPLVGICFLDMAEEEAFNVYEKYVDDMLAPHGKERLYTLLQREDLNTTLQNEGHGFKDAMKYVLPKLLLGPIYHCLHYFEVIKALISTSPNEEDQESLEQASGLLTFLKAMLERKFSGNLPKKKPWETSLRLQGKTGRQAVVQKMSDLQKSIDGWEGKDIWQSCSEFILEGVLNKQVRGRPTERHVFLFDGLIIMCKQNMRRTSVTSASGDFKLKEKFLIRKIEIRDREDTEECKHCFEIQLRDHTNNGVTLSSKSAEEKANWMAALISLQTRSMLERRLDSIIRDEEKLQPLKLPPPEIYRFSVEDSAENIVFEDRRQLPIESPLIKGGLLLKLVERLTYHMYADPKFVKTFLTTYRSFCKPHELLELLKERFDIPEFPLKSQTELPEQESQQARDDLKRFRKEYIKPVQFRVVNVLRHWVDHHYYDFERDMSLLYKLQEFLAGVKGKAMKKMAESIIKVIHRRFESQSTEREFTYQKPLPNVEWHLTREPKAFDLMTLHPIEIARQVTLLEFDLYRAVQPSELVGCAWMKSDKQNTSPNLLKMIAFTNNFTFWMEKCIVMAENIEERVAIVCRILEIMLVFQELNNFNGVLEIVSAINSAPVYRLEHTFEEIPHRFMKSFNEARELNSDHFKKYVEKLRSINPPCVPFLGMYLTNILKIEEGNPDFLPNRPEGIINFSKRRKVAEITGEIQQYQNQPYCLKGEPDMREFFEKLNPREGNSEKEFNDALYNKSLEIEPRGAKQAPKFPRKTEYNLKSPGTKAMSTRHGATVKVFPFSSFKDPGYIQIKEEEVEAASPHCTTPPTPTTPLTPPANAGSDSVFAPVVLGQGDALTSSTWTLSTMTSSGSMTSIIHPHSSHTVPSPLVLDKPISLQPPPLPPRKRNRDSTNSDVFFSQNAPDPPQIPPRGNPPPPVPPRKESMFSTLPRSQSVSQKTGNSSSSLSAHNNLSATLPRCNTADKDTSTRPLLASMLNVNGDNAVVIPGQSVTPKLPPRTYRIAHSRQKSS
ncbi:son of sevenless homolog 2-like [Ylistrum balloti]|uniref:son of sevenless homolog 2-like n=1 Tax=Ylistrum balloti TaxID=509963 RepID=UPI002905D26E|nr:son of sevenless homolog 2-like [Ylistrum balloti]